MADLGKKIAWKTSLATGETELSANPVEVFTLFVDFCKGKVPIKQLKKECELFEKQRAHIRDEYEKFIAEITEEPFVASFIIWVKEVGYQDKQILESAKLLVEHGLIGITDDEGRLWTIGKAKAFDHRTVIDTIRCNREWPRLQRENLVKAYISFMSWLSSETYTYISRFEDPDFARSQGRRLPYSCFLSFLDSLPNENSRLVASLLYFGGSRKLEEILQLTLKNVDFERRVVYFESAPVSYPPHVFEDLKAVVKPRTSGKVFLGRQDLSLNPSTIFRNFKESAIQIGLGSQFTPSTLTASQ